MICSSVSRAFFIRRLPPRRTLPQSGGVFGAQVNQAVDQAHVDSDIAPLLQKSNAGFPSQHW